MPLGLLLRLCEPGSVAGFEWLGAGALAARLRPAKLAYVALRDLDAPERAVLRVLRAHGCYVSTMHDVDARGVGPVVADALASLGAGPVHLSLDIDALDPAVAPATGTRVRGGLSYREGHYVAEAVAASGRLASMDLVEVNSDLGTASAASETVEIGLALVASALGARIFD